MPIAVVAGVPRNLKGVDRSLGVLEDMTPLQTSRSGGLKLLGLVAGLFFLAIIVAFMSVPFLARPASIGAETYRLGVLTIVPDISLSADGSLLLTMIIRDASGNLQDVEPISATAEMAGMSSTPLDISRVSTGLYRAVGRLPMAGRWTFEIRTTEGPLTIPAATSGSF